MGRIKVALVALLVTAIVPIGTGTTVQAEEAPILPQADCGDGFFEVSGSVTSGGQAYESWVEYRFETDAMTPTAAPWLSDAGEAKVQTAGEAYSLCIPTTVEFEGVNEVVTRVQVFAFPDLTGWDGSSEPTVAYTGGEILLAETCAAGCTSNIAIEPPTIWGLSEADLFFVWQGQSYLTNLPAYVPTGVTTVANKGKLSAAFPFAASTTYQVEGKVDTSGNALDSAYGFEYAFSQEVETDQTGIAGQITAPNFYAELTYPVGFPAPSVSQDGSWTGEPTVYLFNVTEACLTGNFQDPSCPVPFDRRHPSKLSATLTSNAPYIIASKYDILPLQYGVIVLSNGSLTYWPTTTAFFTQQPGDNRGFISRGSPFQLALDEPDFFLEAINGGQQQKVKAYALRWDSAGCNGLGCFNSASDAQISSGSSSILGWSPTDGVYNIVFEADTHHDFTGQGPHFAETRHYVQVTGGAISKTCSYTPGGAAPVCEGTPTYDQNSNTYSFAVDEANVILNVIDLSGSPLPRNGVDIAPLDPPWPNGWRQYVNTSSTGYAGLNLSDGNWKIVARAPEGDLTQSDSIVTLSIGEEITTAAPLRQMIALSEPNVRGIVRRPDGEVSRFAQVDIATKREGGGDDWIKSAQTGVPGSFAVSLPKGTFKIAVRPPAGDSLVATTYYLSVDEDLVPCIVSSYADTTCDEATPDGPFTFTLAAPNFSGRLSLPSGVGVPGWVSYGVWDEGLGWFVYSEQGAEVSSRGGFSLNLQVDSFYELRVYPVEATGAAETQVYLYLGASGSWCFTSLNEARRPISCEASQSGEAPIALQTGNFVGTVSGPNGPVTEGWVEATIDSDFGPQNIRGANVRRDGTFSMYLKIETDSWQLVKLTVNPPWDDSTLVAVSRNYWVKGAEICASAPPSSTCTNLVTATTAESFALPAGNVTGVVTKPDQTPAVGVHISVQKKGPEGWWDWVHDKWARTDSTGLYSLGLEDGDYQLTARPFELSGASATTVEIEVRDGVVTTVNGASAAVVNVQLAAPNVKAQIYMPNGSTPVARAWVAVQRKTTQGWWEWMGALGGESKPDGSVEINVPFDATPQTYRLLVHRPWGSTASLSNFYSAEFTLSTAGLREADFTNGQSLKFASPNINIELRQSAAQGAPVVPNAWVYLEKKVGVGQYQWIDIGSSTSFDGKVSLYLPCLDDNTPCKVDDYRVVFDPPWGSSAGLPRFTVDLGDLQTDGTLNSESYPSPNVSGRVMIDGTAERANRNGWIEVFSWNNSTKQISDWLGGTPVSKDGFFSLNLGGGAHYLLRINPNSSSDAPPVEVVVEIDNSSAFVSCEYRIGGDCSAQDFNVDVDFASLPKNARIQVTKVGPGSAKAFVTLSSATLGISMSVVTNEAGVIDVAVPLVNNAPSADWVVSAVVIDGATVLSGSVSGLSLGQGTATAVTVGVS